MKKTYCLASKTLVPLFLFISPADLEIHLSLKEAKCEKSDKDFSSKWSMSHNFAARLTG
jgi:hypothetical protein